MINIRGRAETIREYYEIKKNRDKRAKDLKNSGLTVRRSSMRGQQMHPSYIKDYSGEGKDNNFANGAYRTYFSVVYIVEAERNVRLFGQ